MNDNRIIMRVSMILKRKPDMFGLTFEEDGSVGIADLVKNVPMFTRRGATVESVTEALTNDSKNRFTMFIFAQFLNQLQTRRNF